MKNMLTAIVWVTGIYCFGHLLFSFNSNDAIIMLGDMQLTISLLTRIVELLFSVSLLVYLFKYTDKSPTKNCQRQ